MLVKRNKTIYVCSKCGNFYILIPESGLCTCESTKMVCGDCEFYNSLRRYCSHMKSTDILVLGHSDRDSDHLCDIDLFEPKKEK